MNKKYWNTVHLDGTLPAGLLWHLIDHSYDQVVQGLKRADREALARL